MERAFLIDGTAFCYRAFYALPPLTAPDGRSTNAAYGFARMIQALQEKERPAYLAVAFDVGKPTFRHQRFDQYKEQRKPMPEALVAQLPIIKALLAAYRIPLFEREGFEAEDVLATITRQIAGGAVEVFLVTGDKDALQLVNSHVKVYNPHHKDTLVLDAEAVRARYGVGPERMVDLMALMGDEVDNIPGVPGIGEKTATHLLQRFGSIEGVYAHLEDIKNEGQRKSLMKGKEQLELSRELARIHSEVPLRVERDDLRPQEPDWPALRRLFRELDFKQMLAALDKRSPARTGPAVAMRLADTAQEIEACLKTLAPDKPAAIGGWAFSEAVDPSIRSALLAISGDDSSACLIRLDRAALEATTGCRLAAWLSDPSIPKIGHDLKALKRLLSRLGLRLEGVAGDTMLASYLLNPARANQTLSDVADEHLDEQLGELPVLLEEEELDLGKCDRFLPFAQAACVLYRLHERLLPRLRAHGLEELYRELELPLLSVLAQMEATGVKIDLPYLASLRSSMEVTLKRLGEEIFALAGVTFNLNSPKQLAQVLFERLKLPVVKRTKTGPSTDSEVLQQLSSSHPLPQKLMHYRELSKLVSTYLDALPKLVDPMTGRLHTSFNQAATATGRLSSSEPNLQNIPIKTELGRSIRKAFIPGLPESLLVAADYAQIELKILAHLAQDERLIEAFRRNRDIHRVTASRLYGIPESEVGPRERNAMKAINYGILYGMTAHGLSRELGVSFEEAQRFIDAYFQGYPQVRAFLDEQIAQARRQGFVQTLLGRRRYIPEVNSTDLAVRQFGERMAVNAPVQGTAADLIKRAMVQMAASLESEGLSSRMILQVHDELIFECPRSEKETLIRLVRRVMEGAIALKVPLTVTVKAGANWLELTEVGE